MTKKSKENYEEELQKMYMQHQMLQQYIKGYSEQSTIIEGKIQELISTTDAISEIKNANKGSEIMANLGSQVFVKSDLKNTNEVIVELGAGIYASRSIEDATKILDSRKQELMNVNNQIMMEINKLAMQMKHMEPEIQKLMEKMQGQ
ncbi:MAG: prefoldin subunit alpha [Candidatus Aenigmarchaeota archaeon]|nr:prefoldin subunit alpha [Candidatus Aenigmarchaeota archaeon]